MDWEVWLMFGFLEVLGGGMLAVGLLGPTLLHRQRPQKYRTPGPMLPAGARARIVLSRLLFSGLGIAFVVLGFIVLLNPLAAG
jgi:hypothetical protein